MTHTNQNIPTEINRILIWIRIEKCAVFTNFVAHSERKPDQPEGAQIIS